MRRINAARVGIESGDTVLFSDFQDGGEMWTGTGVRVKRFPITFDEPFMDAPHVQVAMSMWDVHHAANMRMDVRADNVTSQGFDILFQTWQDTRVARVRVSWTAFGEVHDDELWDV